MEKIKPFLEILESDKGKDILIVIIIILVGLGSFELGKLSKNTSGGLKIEYRGQEANALGSIDQIKTSSSSLSLNSNNLEKSQKINSGNFFASSRGTKYYSLSCSAGKTIKQENRIYFKSGQEAEKAGFVLSSSCK